MSYALAALGFITLIVLHEMGHMVAAKSVGMRVEKFYLFFPPRIASIRRGETEYGIGAIPAGGFVKITGMNPEEEIPPEAEGRGYYDQPVWKRIVVIFAGPAVNIAIAFVIFAVLFTSFDREAITPVVGEVERGSPAANVLRPGDEILAVDGRRGDPPLLIERVNSHECPGDPEPGCRASTAATLTVLRDGSEREIAVTPRYDGELGRMRVGFSFGTELLPAAPPHAAAGESAAFMWEITHRTLGVIVRIIDAEQREQISGVVGGYEVTRQAIEFDTRRAVILIGIISLSLGIINLFPVLPLDGGHIFIALSEKLRGRRPSFRSMEKYSAVGFVLVIMLFIVGLTNDIGRLTGEGFPGAR